MKRVGGVVVLKSGVVAICTIPDQDELRHSENPSPILEFLIDITCINSSLDDYLIVESCCFRQGGEKISEIQEFALILRNQIVSVSSYSKGFIL